MADRPATLDDLLRSWFVEDSPNPFLRPAAIRRQLELLDEAYWSVSPAARLLLRFCTRHSILAQSEADDIAPLVHLLAERFPAILTLHEGEPLRRIRPPLREALGVRIEYDLGDYFTSYTWLSSGDIGAMGEGNAVFMMLGDGLKPFTEFAAGAGASTHLLPGWLQPEPLSLFEREWLG